MKRSDWTDKRSSIDLGSRRSSSFNLNKQQRGLHTVNEEDFYHQKQQHRKSFQSQEDYGRAMDASSSSPLFQRKQRSSVAHFNNFPLTKRFDDNINENQRSRADVLAETEAKLSGGHQRYSGGMVPHEEKQNRRLSEPNARLYNQQPQPQDHMSFQQYTMSSSKTMDFDQQKRRQDWRSSVSTGARPHSTVGIVNNHRFSTGSSIFENNSNNNNGHQRKPLFTAHLPFSSVVPQLKSNMLVSGLLRVNKRNRSDAYVFCEDFNADIYICGSRDRNRALEGDHVAIKLTGVDRVMLEKHEKEEAKLARNNGNPVVRKPDEEDEKEIIFGGEEDVDIVTPRFCGVVVAILDRAQKQVFSG